MWTKIAGIILRNRIAFIAGVLLGTIFMGFQARKIQMSYESADLLPKTDSAYLDYTDRKSTRLNSSHSSVSLMPSSA